MTMTDRALLAQELRLSGCVFADDEADVILRAAPDRAAMFDMLQRRIAGMPLEHIVERAGFHGLDVIVRAGVFVPRQRTEWLVVQACAVIRPHDVVLDLCCGTAAIGVAVLASVPVAELHAADIDPVALACAHENLAGHSNAFVHRTDLFEGLPDDLRGALDVVAANAPYVPSSEIGLMPIEAREYEPREALDGGVDGLDVQRRLIAAAPQWLAPGGHLLVETSRIQAERTADLFVRAGFDAAVTSDDERAATVVVGRQPA